MLSQRFARPLMAVVLTLALLLSLTPGAFARAKPPAPSDAMDFGRWTTLADWSTGQFDRVLSTTIGDPAGDGALVLDPAAGLLSGTDTSGIYNGGAYLYGTYTSAVHTTAMPFDWAVASWDAATPDGTWLQLELKALISGTWTKWYNMGVWASGTGTVQRHSVNNQKDKNGTVATDTLTLTKAATAYQCRITLFTVDPALSPRVNLISAIAHNTDSTLAVIAPETTAWGIDLNVPERSQMDYLPDGSGWCSPTSTSMVMAYWAQETGDVELDQTVPTVAALCYDYTYGGTGNWPFNTAAAASYGPLAYVSRFQSMSQIEQWIKLGIPVVIGIAFSAGELTGAPIDSTAGHLIVVRGFDANGNVIVNDPAADLAEGEVVRIVYDRAELESVWLGASGIVYLIYPAGHAIPANSGGSW